MSGLADHILLRASTWRIAAWAGAAGLLLLPLVAMQFTDEVDWTLSDFVFMGVLLGGLALAHEFLSRQGGLAYRAGVVLALGGAFLMVWVNAAVGIIGDDMDANLPYLGSIAVGVVGAVIGGFRPAGMARAMVAAAVAQALVPAIALIAGLAPAAAVWSPEVPGSAVFFAVLWLTSAWLFRQDAREQAADAAR